MGFVKPTKSVSSIIETILRAHSAAGMTSGCLRYNRKSVSAAFFFTKLCEVLLINQIWMMNKARTTYGEISRR